MPWCFTRRLADRRTCCFIFPPSPMRRAEAAHGRRLGRGQSPGAAPCGCAAQRAAQFRHGAGVSGRRRAGGDAASAQCGASRHSVKTSAEKRWACLDWWKQSEPRAALRRVLQEQDGIDPDDVIMSPDRAHSRAHFDHLLSGGQSCAGGIGDQEHGHRSVAGGTRTRLPAQGPAKVFVTEPRRFKAIKSARWRKAT
jgi:hypothetical protein